MKFFSRNQHVILFAVLLLVTLITSLPVFAQDTPAGEQLVQVHRCYACHHMNNALIGPPYQAIAARHAGQKDVMGKVLATKIILGGGSNWGVVPMVPNEHVPEADALAMARWILELSNAR
jgi:cytochrome c